MANQFNFDEEILKSLLEKSFDGFTTSLVPSNAKITCDTITKSMSEIEKSMPEMLIPFQHETLNPFQFSGFKFYEGYEPPLEPKIKLSENCPVSDEFRAKCNSWYIKMFGYKERKKLYEDERVYMFGDIAICNKTTLRTISKLVTTISKLVVA